MNQNFDLDQYLTDGVEALLRETLKLTLRCPRESLFLSRLALSVRHASGLRARAAAEGEHIPSFLIASITSQCNLHCTGCYARAGGTCHEGESKESLTAAQWGKIFTQAEELGICFILLAGGEPLIRRDVLEEAAKHPSLVFPVFSNGTMLDGSYIDLFDRNRNLIPILSIEGGMEQTDARRGEGVFLHLLDAMRSLRSRDILFGASVTVTRVNLAEVTGGDFLSLLNGYGCKAIVYVEYVPADGASQEMAPTEQDRLFLERRILNVRSGNGEMILISFPGDEKETGGCLAAGRGFFHINASGGAEPCPFSPFSDTSLKHTSLRGALRSPLFTALRSGHLLTGNHDGGCVLFEHEAEVRELCKTGV